MTITYLQFLTAFAEASGAADDPQCDIKWSWEYLARFLNDYKGNGSDRISWEEGGAEAGKVAGEFAAQAKGAPLTLSWAAWGNLITYDLANDAFMFNGEAVTHDAAARAWREMAAEFTQLAAEAVKAWILAR